MRNYKKKTTRGQFDPENCRKALNEVSAGKLSITKAAIKFRIPRTTLNRKFLQIKKSNVTNSKEAIKNMPIGYAQPKKV